MATSRTGWRIAERVISVAIGGAAVSGAIYLGVTGPLISPVAPAAVQSTATDAADSAVVPDPVTGQDLQGRPQDGRRAGGRGGGGRR